MESSIYKTGSWHAFRIIKIINIPFEGSFFVLKNYNEERFLLPVRFYYSYNLKIGTILVCRIDKVNCNRRVFLEPVHPFYVEGKIYKFRSGLKTKMMRKDKELKEIILVRDIFGNKAFVSGSPGVLDSEGFFPCRVDRIKKGFLHLTAV